MKYYLDNAATTPLCKAAKEVIKANLDTYANPSSKHILGRSVRQMIDNARKTVAEEINCNPDEIFFTSGASEANSWILQSFKSILTTTAEHHSVLNAAKSCKNFDLIDCTTSGVVMSALEETLYYKNYECVSIQHVNNEIGYINDIKAIRELVPENTLFHVDATQSIPRMKVDVKSLGIDAMSFSGHKFGAMKGIGVLYVKKKWQYKLKRLIYGGSQERKYRGGTENVLGILSLETALKARKLDGFKEQVNAFKDMLGNRTVRYNTRQEDSIKTGIISVTIDRVESESLMLLLEMEDIFVSAGSACAGSGEVSHVLKAIGMTDTEARATIRISIGHDLSPADMTYVAGRIAKKSEYFSKFA